MLTKECPKEKEKDLIFDKIYSFSDSVENEYLIEIDGVYFKGCRIKDGKKEYVVEEDCCKVIKHNDKTKDSGIAYLVSIDTILQNKNEDIIKAIKEGITDTRLNGITRIVGYYSRVNNWNKSKVGELEDRRSGKYSFGETV